MQVLSRAYWARCIRAQQQSAGFDWLVQHRVVQVASTLWSGRSDDVGACRGTDDMPVINSMQDVQRCSAEAYHTHSYAHEKVHVCSDCSEMPCKPGVIVISADTWCCTQAACLKSESKVTMRPRSGLILEHHVKACHYDDPDVLLCR